MQADYFAVRIFLERCPTLNLRPPLQLESANLKLPHFLFGLAAHQLPQGKDKTAE